VSAPSGRTALLALIADPVVQARTPALANAALAARGVDAALLPMQVPDGALAPVIDGLRRIGNFKGAVVSMPHKVTVASLVDALTPEARQAGACNAIRRAPDARLEGTTLDGEGFVAGLRGAGHEVRGRRIFMVGAGGAAAAIAFALAKHGAGGLTIANRTRSKAEVLAARVRAAHPSVEIAADGSPVGHDVVVNATSIGMRPEDGSPVDPSCLGPGMVAADVVLRPGTAFLLEAGRRGAVAHGGEPMLAAQVELLLDYMLWQDPLA
jgi:shikimate dehydrogenase